MVWALAPSQHAWRWTETALQNPERSLKTALYHDPKFLKEQNSIKMWLYPKAHICFSITPKKKPQISSFLASNIYKITCLHQKTLAMSIEEIFCCDSDGVSSIFFETILMGIILIVKQVVMHQYIPISLDKLIVSVLS